MLVLDKKILVIRLSSLGDVLLTTPILRSIKKKFPGLQIDFVVKPAFKQALSLNQNITNIYEYTPDTYKYLVKILKENNYNFALDLQNNIRSRQVLSKLRINRRSLKKPVVKKLLLVKFKINLFKKIITIPQRYAAAFDENILDGKGLDLFIPRSIKPSVEFSKNNIGFAPGAKHFTKRWPKEYFIELGKKLAGTGYRIILFGGSADKHLCNEITKEIAGSMNLCSDDDLFFTSINMKACGCIITNDSGLMHTAVALNVPVFAIFGSTVKEFGFAPFGSVNVVVENQGLECRPCSHIGRKSCPQKHFNCMKKLTPDFIFDELIKFILENERHLALNI